MRIALKLNAIEQEHLQELYDAAGVARDELPFTEQFDKLCQDFQDRTFKNAEPEQVFGALLKYVKSSTCRSSGAESATIDADTKAHLRTMLKRHGRSGRLLPYSSEFEAALRDFNAVAAKTMTPREFWLAIVKTQGRSRRAPQESRSRRRSDSIDEEG
jgi:hypothetical protein